MMRGNARSRQWVGCLLSLQRALLFLQRAGSAESKVPCAIGWEVGLDGARQKVDQGWGWRQARTVWAREPAGCKTFPAGLWWSEPGAFVCPPGRSEQDQAGTEIMASASEAF